MTKPTRLLPASQTATAASDSHGEHRIGVNEYTEPQDIVQDIGEWQHAQLDTIDSLRANVTATRESLTTTRRDARLQRSKAEGDAMREYKAAIKVAEHSYDQAVAAARAAFDRAIQPATVEVEQAQRRVAKAYEHFFQQAHEVYGVDLREIYQPDPDLPIPGLE